MSARARIAGVVGLAGLGLLVACGSPQVQQTAKAPEGSVGVVNTASKDDRSRCEYKNRRDREIRETAGPGTLTPNVRRVYAIVGKGADAKRVLVCREIDTNLDGVKDVVRVFNEDGKAVRELSDANWDGKVDTWITFAGADRAVPAKVLEDTSGDGKPDVTRIYSGGKVIRVQRDTNHDGKTDVYEVYASGRLQRVGEDLDHDGRVDRWSRDEIARRLAEEKERRDAEAEAKKKKAEDAKAREASKTR